jgi:hypothetical protein
LELPTTLSIIIDDNSLLLDLLISAKTSSVFDSNAPPPPPPHPYQTMRVLKNIITYHQGLIGGGGRRIFKIAFLMIFVLKKIVQIIFDINIRMR